MMYIRLPFLLGMMLCVMAVTPAAAHSMQDAVNEIQQNEPYLQQVNQVAPGFALTDAAGRQHTLAGYRGKVVILNFIYARCREACPLHSVLLAKLQQQAKAAGLQEQVQFVTIATDTEDVVSTAAIMRNYGNTYNLDPANWVFLSRGVSDAADAGIRAAKAYGLDFVVVSGDEQMHGVVTHVIDQQGMMKARFHGLRFKPAHLTEYAGSLLRAGNEKNQVENQTDAGNSLLRWRPSEKYPWVISFLLIPGFLLLAWSLIRLKRGISRRASAAPGTANAIQDPPPGTTKS